LKYDSETTLAVAESISILTFNASSSILDVFVDYASNSLLF